MARCGCGSTCTCSVTVLDTASVDMTITGNGSAANPYEISAKAQPVPIVVADTPCIDLGGNGTAGSPLTASPIIAPDVADPGPSIGNGLECGATGLKVAPSADAGNTLVYGADGRLFVPASAALCVATPIILDPPAIPGTGCLITSGGGCPGDPYHLQLGISDDDCNGLTCNADGLFAFSDPTTIPGNVNQCYGGGPFGPFNGNIGNLVIFGPFCVTLTNPSRCRNLVPWIVDGGALAAIHKDAGYMQLSLQVSIDGGATYNSSSWIGLDDGPNFGALNGALQPGNRFAFTIPPLSSMTTCVQFTVDSSNVVNGGVGGLFGCLQIGSYWER